MTLALVACGGSASNQPQNMCLLPPVSARQQLRKPSGAKRKWTIGCVTDEIDHWARDPYHIVYYNYRPSTSRSRSRTRSRSSAKSITSPLRSSAPTATPTRMSTTSIPSCSRSGRPDHRHHAGTVRAFKSARIRSARDLRVQQGGRRQRQPAHSPSL